MIAGWRSVGSQIDSCRRMIGQFQCRCGRSRRCHSHTRSTLQTDTQTIHAITLTTTPAPLTLTLVPASVGLQTWSLIYFSNILNNVYQNIQQYIELIAGHRWNCEV